MFLPVSLRVEGRACLVVGGGPVAARKAAALLECGALVTVVARSTGPEIEALGPLTLERRPYEAGEAGRYRLVVTATGVPEVDAAVAADAEAAGVWVNSADDLEHCSVILPAIHRDGAVSVAVSTDGTSPALASWLRDGAARALGPGLGQLARLLGQARAAVRAQGRSTEDIDWRAVLDGPLPELVRQDRLEEARALLDRVTGARIAGTRPDQIGQPAHTDRARRPGEGV